MTTAFEILAGDFLAANPPTERERAALAVARGDAELGQIIIQLMRVRRLAAKSRLDRVVRYVQTADEHLDSIALGAWALPDGKARELIAQWRQDTRAALDTMIGALGSVHAIDAERARPRLDAEDRQSAAHEPTRDRFAVAACKIAREMVEAWRRGERDADDRLIQRRPTKNAVALRAYREINTTSTRGKADRDIRAAANELYNRALTPDRLARLGLTNALDEVSANTRRTLGR